MWLTLVMNDPLYIAPSSSLSQRLSEVIQIVTTQSRTRLAKSDHINARPQQGERK